MIGDKGYEEGYIDYMYRRMNEESEKCKLKDVFMNPLDAARRIVALEKRIDEELYYLRDCDPKHSTIPTGTNKLVLSV